MEIWGSSEAELLEHAQKNTPEEMQFFMCSLQEMLCHMIGQESNYEWDSSREMPLYVLTNSQGMYGASCILYDGVLEQAAEQLGSDLYVLPSSIHEVILLPAKGEGINSVKALGEMVASVNCSGNVADEEVLSDDVYYYDRVKQQLAVAV